jgi:hypothetical protein
MLLENVGSDSSQMLSNTREKHRGDPIRRYTLFPRHGSNHAFPCPHSPAEDWVISVLQRWDSHADEPAAGLHRYDSRKRRHTNGHAAGNYVVTLSTEPFVADMFSFHDKRFSYHPNVIYNDKDCRGEMAVRLLSRMVAHYYNRQDQRNGPFFLQLNKANEGCTESTDESLNLNPSIPAIYFVHGVLSVDSAVSAHSRRFYILANRVFMLQMPLLHPI